MRRLFNLLIGASSALFLVGTALIIYSCFYGSEGVGVRGLVYRTGNDLGLSGPFVPTRMLEQVGGGINVNHARLTLGFYREFQADNGDRNPHSHSHYTFSGNWGVPGPSGPWFYYIRRGGPPIDPDPREGEWEIVAPAPLVILTFAVLPAVAFYRRLARKKGHCQICGYDLRATPDRCPECGTIASALNKKATGEKT